MKFWMKLAKPAQRTIRSLLNIYDLLRKFPKILVIEADPRKIITSGSSFDHLEVNLKFQKHQDIVRRFFVSSENCNTSKNN